MTAKGYLAALESVILRDAEEEVYRTYITDVLRYLLKSLSGGTCKRYADLVKPEKPPADHQTGAEIASDLMKKLGLKSKYDSPEGGALDEFI